MVASFVEAYSSVQGGTGNGLTITTSANPVADDVLVACMIVNGNADTITPPGGWSEITVSDNSIATSGGQIRAWRLVDPAASTAYTWTVGTSTRRSLIGALCRGVDNTTPINIAGSLQSAPGANHTPPSLTSTVNGCLILDFPGLRQFAPDTADWTVPAAGLTWTEQADVQGADSNNNCRLALGTATQATAGAIPTNVWTQSDLFEDSIIIRVALQPAAGGDVAISDVTGGGTAGSSTETLSVDKILSDTTGGGTAGGSTETLAVDRVISDGTGGGTAGGSQQTLAVDTILGDTTGGGTAAGTQQVSSNDTVINDTTGGASAGGSAETLTVDTVLATGAGGGTAGGSADTISVGGDVTLSDVPGGGSAGSSPAPTTSEVVHDTMAMPVILQAMSCLQTEALKVANPPAAFHIRPGANFTAMADSHNDECCAGIAWVRPGVMYESEPFPTQKSDASLIESFTWAVQVELGIIRCIPVIGEGRGDVIPSATQWLAATVEAMDDAAALRRAICCLRDVYGQDAVIAGQIQPLENEGNCGGQSVIVTLRVQSCDCVEV